VVGSGIPISFGTLGGVIVGYLHIPRMRCGGKRDTMLLVLHMAKRGSGNIRCHWVGWLLPTWLRTCFSAEEMVRCDPAPSTTGVSAIIIVMKSTKDLI